MTVAERSAALVGNRNLGRRLSLTMMVHRGDWGAPSVMAAFAGFVHDRESTATMSAMTIMTPIREEFIATSLLRNLRPVNARDRS